MAKTKTIYVCQNCGSQRARWEGRCTECGTWNSLVEETFSQPSASASGGKGRGWSVGSTEKGEALLTVKLSDEIVESKMSRTGTGFSELDRVLGGGLVKGSYILVGGDPGIGKSTLLLQMAGGLAKSQLNVLYVSAEESVQQTALRAQRLGVRSSHVEMMAESLLENIIEVAKAKKPDVLVIDSIQTVYLNEIQSAPGSVSQVRECAGHLMSLAKHMGITIFLVGHVTKDGNIAGPRVLEHMVDTVLSFEGDNHHQFRLLRALKNRFGATNELGVFQMDSAGLKEVANPSEFFLEDRSSSAIGSSVFAAMEGTRPLLCEIQALATSTTLAMPRRTSLGFDHNRVHMILAVLDKYLHMSSHQSDVFINVVGGLRISEPAADAAVAAAILSSSANVALTSSACFMGEIGLTGEIRAVNFVSERIKEVIKLGFSKLILPASNQKHISKELKNSQVEFLFVKNVFELKNSLGKISSKVKSSKRNDADELHELD